MNVYDIKVYSDGKLKPIYDPTDDNDAHSLIKGFVQYSRYKQKEIKKNDRNEFNNYRKKLTIARNTLVIASHWLLLFEKYNLEELDVNIDIKQKNKHQSMYIKQYFNKHPKFSKKIQKTIKKLKENSRKLQINNSNDSPAHYS